MKIRSSRETCGLCGAALLFTSDWIGGVLAEGEYLCDGCGLYELEYLYGASRERIGFATFEWLGSAWEGEKVVERHPKPYEAMKVAWREMRAAVAHPDWPGVRRMPLAVVADWFDNHDWGTQATAIRASLAETREVL